MNLVPSCRDKSELYHQEKMPLTIAPVCPILINTRSRRHRRPRLVHRYPGHPRVRTRVRRPQSRRTSHSVRTPVPSLRRAPSPLPSTSSSDEDEEPARPIPRSLSENIPIDREVKFKIFRLRSHRFFFSLRIEHRMMTNSFLMKHSKIFSFVVESIRARVAVPVKNLRPLHHVRREIFRNVMRVE